MPPTVASNPGNVSVAASTIKSRPVPTQSRVLPSVPTQSRVVPSVPTQSRVVPSVPTQSRVVLPVVTQSREIPPVPRPVPTVPPQSRRFPPRPTQSRAVASNSRSDHGTATGPVFFSDMEDSDAKQEHRSIKVKTRAPIILSSDDEESDGHNTFPKGKGREAKEETEGEVDEEDEQQGDEEEYVKGEEEINDEGFVKEYYMKGGEQKVRYIPQKGKPNTTPCDACYKKNQTCYTQNSTKARGACYDCGRMKNKCLYTVSFLLFFAVILSYSSLLVTKEDDRSGQCQTCRS
jgi:hypothetical protein